MPTIFHVDMDAFFVSVEELFDPSLKGKAVVVGGQAHERGVVSAASYEARKFGVHSAMPLRQAAKLCSHAIFLNGQRERYVDSSRAVEQVLRSFTPVMEMASIDEAYLDMTGTERLHGPPFRAAHRLHAAVSERTGLNCSIGIAASRMVAKVASDQAKRHGILHILPGQEATFLGPLDIRRIPGVGAKTEESLNRLGIRQVRDLAALDESVLGERFGKLGLALAGKAKGEDAGGWYDTAIGDDDGPKSISHEHTYTDDTADQGLIESTLAKLSEMVARRLRDHALHAKTVQLKLRYQDFSTITRAHTLRQPTQLDAELIREVRALFRSNWKPGRRVRLVGVQVSSLGAAAVQMDLLSSGQDEKWQKALSAVDKLRGRFGDTTVSLAVGMRGEFRRRIHDGKEHTKPD